MQVIDHSTTYRLKNHLLLACLIVAPFAFSSLALGDEPAPAQNEAKQGEQTFVGRAFDKKGKTLLYTEKHSLNRQDGKLTTTQTRYVTPEGKTIATIKADYSKSQFAPDFKYKDVRTNRSRSSAIKGSNVEFSNGGKTKSLKRPNLKSFVVGQGFHSFVVANFNALSSGKTVKLKYGVPAKFKIYDFRVRKTKDLGKGRIRLKVEVDSWLARRFAPNLQIDYDVATKRLIRYKGLSNLLDADGDEQDVVIRYRYP